MEIPQFRLIAEIEVQTHRLSSVFLWAYFPFWTTVAIVITAWLHLQAFLRILCEYTSDTVEKRRLQELCSKEGKKLVNSFMFL